MLQHTCCVNYHAISLDNSLKLSTGSRPEVPCKKGVLKNFAKFAGKTSVPETLCRLKVADIRNFIYKLPHKLLIRLIRLRILGKEETLEKYQSCMVFRLALKK